jgi:hypothetical protein
MTSTTVQGYLESGYLEGPYNTNQATGADGFQAKIIIQSSKSVGQQARVQIDNFLKSSGLQAQIQIAGNLKNVAMQVSVSIQDDLAKGMQALTQVSGVASEHGMNARAFIAGLKSLGFEVRVDPYPTGICPDGGGYLEYDYLMAPYLTELFCTRPGVQVFITINTTSPHGMQSRIFIQDEKVIGFQSRITIEDWLVPTGMQANIISSFDTGFQAFATLYNSTNLRILCEFPSRGLTASNWTATNTVGSPITAAGDFSVQNLDTDIVEQVWRSDGTITGVRLKTDTGLPQGVFVDTLAILNHNMTPSATVTLLGSNDPTFSIIGVVIPLEVRPYDMYWVSAEIPPSGYRYWRFDIDDFTNPDGYIEIGTILFGQAEIFQGECFVDEIEFELKDYTDTVRTEGFTNVTNSRTQKARLRLDFRSLNYLKRNFAIMRNMFQRDRTVNKCLWIPTPDPVFQEVTATFAVFGKMSSVPTERHNSKGRDLDFVSFTVEVDEGL